jgi:hypothetical protein
VVEEVLFFGITVLMLTENRSVVIVVFLHGNQLIFICTYILFLYIMHIYNK